jgi:hypothetical protein
MRNSTLFFTFVFFTSLQWSFGQTPTDTFSRSFSFPPVGLAGGETMQISLVNLAADVGPNSGLTPVAASCTGSVSFVNAAGAAIGDPSMFSVGSGVTQSISLPFANSGISNMRGEVRAVVALTVADALGAPPCSLTISLEVFDSSNITHVYLHTVVAPSPSTRDGQVSR